MSVGESADWLVEANDDKVGVDLVYLACEAAQVLRLGRLADADAAMNHEAFHGFSLALLVTRGHARVDGGDDQRQPIVEFAGEDLLGQ